MMIILLLCLCFATKNYEVDGWMPNLSENEDIDLEKHLKVINKPPIKTIHQTEFGTIVDCIDINKQLAFDNPLLKNHKIQMKPSFQDATTKVNVRNRSSIFSEIGLRKNLCPKGTVPIQRTTKEDLMRANWSSNNIGTLNRASPGSHFAEAHLKFFDPVYFGIAGTISAYNPPVGNGQMSAAYIWLSNKKNNADVNTIQAGWQVYPSLSRDKRTHFFASWSNSLKHTGCTNFLCPGFVQVSRRIFLGTPVRNTSTYGGTQFDMSLSFTQDPNTKNWWLRAQNMNVGYFPAALFSNNFLYANQAGWTGRTSTTNGGLSPPMGSGHFPDGNPQHSCYIARIMFMDRFKQVNVPLRSNVETYVDNPRCYDVKYYDYRGGNLQHVLMLGGPGGNCGN